MSTKTKLSLVFTEPTLENYMGVCKQLLRPSDNNFLILGENETSAAFVKWIEGLEENKTIKLLTHPAGQPVEELFNSKDFKNINGDYVLVEHMKYTPSSRSALVIDEVTGKQRVDEIPHDYIEVMVVGRNGHTWREWWEVKLFEEHNPTIEVVLE